MNGSMPVAGEQRTRRKNAGRPLGRRALLWAAGLFALTQAVLGLLLARDGFAVRDPARHLHFERLRGRMAGAASPPKVVVLLGSSHVAWGLQTGQISREVSEELGRPVVLSNQGILGGATFRSLLAVDRLLREGVVPDLVVLEIFPARLDERWGYSASNEAALPRNLLDEGDIELIPRHGYDRPDLGIARHVARLAPGYLHRVHLVNRVAFWLLPLERRMQPSLPDEMKLGDFPTEHRAKARAHARDDYDALLQDLSLDDPRQLGLIADLVGRVRAKGARVVFLAMPEGPAFRSWYPPDRWAASVSWLRDLAARHDVPLIDARQWTDDEELFIDSHHLSKTGAERFSRWLAREVLVPQLRADE